MSGTPSAQACSLRPQDPVTVEAEAYYQALAPHVGSVHIARAVWRKPVMDIREVYGCSLDVVAYCGWPSQTAVVFETSLGGAYAFRLELIEVLHGQRPLGKDRSNKVVIRAYDSYAVQAAYSDAASALPGVDTLEETRRFRNFGQVPAGWENSCNRSYMMAVGQRYVLIRDRAGILPIQTSIDDEQYGFGVQVEGRGADGVPASVIWLAPAIAALESDADADLARLLAALDAHGSLITQSSSPPVRSETAGMPRSASSVSNPTDR